MTPVAVITHNTEDRIRLRMASCRGDRPFFDAMAEKVSAAFPSWSVQVNALTGSMLVCGKDLATEQLIDFGRSKGLFETETTPAIGRSMALSVTEPLHSADAQIKALTGNRIDLPGAVFVALLIFGIIELIRGNWRTPPWYTAFWYAFGLYSKSLIDAPYGAAAVDIDGE